MAQLITRHGITDHRWKEEYFFLLTFVLFLFIFVNFYFLREEVGHFWGRVFWFCTGVLSLTYGDILRCSQIDQATAEQETALNVELCGFERAL